MKRGRGISFIQPLFLFECHQRNSVDTIVPNINVFAKTMPFRLLKVEFAFYVVSMSAVHNAINGNELLTERAASRGNQSINMLCCYVVYIIRIDVIFSCLKRLIHRVQLDDFCYFRSYYFSFCFI